MIDLESLQKMWEEDSEIDKDNLHDESLKIPQLHAKYFDLYNTIFLLRKKADPDVYIENPFPKKIRDKDTMQKYLDADGKLSNSSLKIEYYDTMLTYIESILKVIQNRTFQIKNAIEFMRFQSGLG